MRTGPLLVRVVALGDSLTVGFQSYGFNADVQRSTPYTDFLHALAKGDSQLSSLSVEIINKGVNGDLTEQMLARFDFDVVCLSPAIVIILGGSNDLGLGLPPREVFLNLREMYELSLGKGITPIACAVPSILGFDAGIPPRLTLNELIGEYSSKRGLRCADLFRATKDRDARLALQYSSDGLHLNTEGYRKVADTIYEEALRPLLRVVGAGLPNRIK
jgi:lysophospholipase L1-like esterase